MRPKLLTVVELAEVRMVLTGIRWDVVKFMGKKPECRIPDNFA